MFLSFLYMITSYCVCWSRNSKTNSKLSIQKKQFRISCCPSWRHSTSESFQWTWLDFRAVGVSGAACKQQGFYAWNNFSWVVPLEPCQRPILCNIKHWSIIYQLGSGDIRWKRWELMLGFYLERHFNFWTKDKLFFRNLYIKCSPLIVSIKTGKLTEHHFRRVNVFERDLEACLWDEKRFEGNSWGYVSWIEVSQISCNDKLAC